LIATAWYAVCDLDDILPDSGVCADVAGRQIAVFRVDDVIYALDNFDPAGGANVLSRGLIGDLGGELVVASPLYKHHYSLTTGRCLEEPEYSVGTYPARLDGTTVWIDAVERGRARDDAGATAGAAARAAADATASVAARATSKRRLVVIGNGMAGMRTVEELLQVAPDLYDIEVFGAEPRGNYNRVLLSPVLAGEKRIEDIMLHPLEWYREHAVTLHSGDAVVAVDRARRRVIARSGREARYDRLLFATGSTPTVLPIPGNDLKGVVTFRDLDDVATMLDAARPRARAVVIGGGLLGLEAANGLKCRGMHVTVVHLHARLMDRQLDATAAALLQSSLETRGLEFKMRASTVAILGGSQVSGVRFADGSELPADLVVMAAGVRPNVELARAAGLRCERGIVVDDTLQTFDPSVYAVGECVEHRNRTFGLVAPLWEQARVCAAHLAEIGVARYVSTQPPVQLKVTGIDLFSVGDLGGGARTESLVFRDTQRGVYKRLIVEDDTVRGAVLYGDTADGPWYAELMNEARNIGPLRDTLLFGAAQFGAT
jgi:nitrite reductase (NADH) large subunit